MRYRITKLFRKNAAGETCSATVTLNREGGQMRKISGHIGSAKSDGDYITELRGSDRIVTVEMDAETTLHIQPCDDN